LEALCSALAFESFFQEHCEIDTGGSEIECASQVLGCLGSLSLSMRPSFRANDSVVFCTIEQEVTVSFSSQE
jgi:hypothetical protein